MKWDLDHSRGTGLWQKGDISHIKKEKGENEYPY